MQTFLPYPDFVESARCLDSRRLNKQIQETRQILRHLLGELPFKGGFRNHPAVLQWAGYEEALKLYQNCCIDEWLTRKKKNGEPITSNRDKYRNVNYDKLVFPWWLGDERFHSSHRGNLKRKDPSWYGQFNWPDLIHPYWWPVEVNNARK
jgi:hypothetical protein